jgi:hypothetical protein
VRGTPVALKCHKCKRGMWGHGPAYLGVKPTGRCEEKLRHSNHHGTGRGGRSFYGYRGEVKCLDCGHVWFSTHPQSGRKRLG